MIKTILASNLLRATSIYTFTNIVNAAIPFILIPILTRRLSTEDYGIIAMFSMMVGFIGPFVGVSVHGAISRKYLSKDTSNLSRYVGNCFYILFISTAIVFLTIVIVRNPISNYTKIPINWIYAIVMVSFSQFITLSLLTIFQSTFKPIYYGIIQISQTLLNFLLTIYFVVGLDRTWDGRLEAQLIAFIVVGAVCFFILIKNELINFEFNIGDIKHALRFSLPLIPHSIGGMSIAMTDRFFITNMVSINETGIYTIAFQIGSVLNLLTLSFNNAYVPWLFNKLNNITKEWKIRIVKFTYVYFLGLLIISILSIYLLPPFLDVFVDNKFHGANTYAVWIILGYVFNGMYLMVTNYIFYMEKTKILAWITFGCSLLNVPLCYYFIKINGPVGAAQSTSIVFFLCFLLTWLLSAKIYKMPWSLKN